MWLCTVVIGVFVRSRYNDLQALNTSKVRSLLQLVEAADYGAIQICIIIIIIIIIIINNFILFVYLLCKNDIVV